MEQFKQKFTEMATNNFGSGWTWLSEREGKLVLGNTSNAATPLTTGAKPLLTIDVWEHAYYIDFLNKRPAYIDNWW
eukprot:CAMPEP_0174250488 /NCGR_PEP_ID=MMETSP0439-20130205/649_1 /TAXON_ID=0 /ORGANISM="Stereomyxa ramosa, Strain Chinc5" /LENGTH=75 /DNA_ID=CAMNT_0015330577 /DNA_START=420 /DNA_END=644 /DNA_ORIENTATION=-